LSLNTSAATAGPWEAAVSRDSVSPHTYNFNNKDNNDNNDDVVNPLNAELNPTCHLLA